MVFYRQLAKIVEQYVHKGDKLYVEGRLRYNTYDDQQGRRHYVTEIQVENLELLTPKPKPAAEDSTATKKPAAKPGTDDELPF